jgi:CheY-like chemotaxis protein
MADTILLVDDNLIHREHYIHGLENEGYKVEYCRTTDKAISFARNNQDTIAAIIFDIMMPPGHAYANIDTDEGLKTGLYLRETLYNLCPNVAFVALTNVENEETLKELYEAPQVVIAPKSEFVPSKLPNFVVKQIQENYFDLTDFHSDQRDDIYNHLSDQDPNFQAYMKDEPSLKLDNPGHIVVYSNGKLVSIGKNYKDAIRGIPKEYRNHHCYIRQITQKTIRFRRPKNIFLED